MFRGKTVHLALSLVFYSNLTVFGQWSAANSGTTNNLNGAYLLDSGIAFVVGDAGTILKSTDTGATWAPLLSGTTNILREVYFFDGNQRGETSQNTRRQSGANAAGDGEQYPNLVVWVEAAERNMSVR